MIKSFIAFLNIRGIEYDTPDNTLVKFRLDGLVFLFQFREEDDPRFIRLLLPKIEDFEGNEGIIIKRMIDVTSSIKVVKSVIINNEVWLVAEQFMASNENVNQVFERMIDVLKIAYHHYASAAMNSSQSQAVE